MKKRLLFWLVMGISSGLWAQTIPVWDLNTCIEKAQSTNLRIRQSELAVTQNGIQAQQAKQNLYPTASGAMSQAYNYGFSVNPINNQVVSKGLVSGNYNVSGGMNIYAGGQVRYGIDQSSLDLQASQTDVQQAQRDLALNVAQAYLQVLLSRELVKNATTQLSSTRTQLERSQRLIDAGVAAEATRYTLDAQMVSEELALVNAKNQETVANLTLRQLLNLQPEILFTLAPLDVTNYTPSLAKYDLEASYREAEATQPSIKSADLRIQSARVGVSLAGAALKPSVSAFAQVNTRTSSIAQRTTGEFVTVNTPILINGQTVEIGQQQPVFEKTPLYSQLLNNIGFGAGLSLNVPIYNQGRNLTNIQLAEINVKNAQINAALQRQNLRQSIERAYWDVEISHTNYLATVRQIEAFEKALSVVEKQLNLGTGNQTDFILSKNNLNRAQTDVLRAKYDFLFKSKVLEFYRNGVIEVK